MKKILVLGAGKSSFYLLEYLSKKAGENGWEILVCDRDEASLSAHASGFDNLSTQVLDIADETTTDAMVSMADLVVWLIYTINRV